MSKSIHNLRCNPSSECYKIEEKAQFGISWSAVAPSDAKEKNRNMGAQTQSLTCTKALKIFWKIYFLYEFWCTQTCSFRAIFGLPMRTLTTAACAIYRRVENNYMGAHQRRRADVKGVTPLPCSRVLVVKEKMRSSEWFLLVDDRKGIRPQNFAPTPFYGTQKKCVGYSP